MQSFLDRLAEALNGLSRGILWLSAVGLVAMTAVVGWQIFGRYVLNDTPHWSETLSVYLMFYYVLLAAAVGVREHLHLGLVFVHDRLPRRGRQALDVIINLAIIGFGAVTVWYGSAYVESTWNQTIPTLGLPTGSLYLPIPIAGALFVLFALENALRTLAGRETRRAWS